MRRLIDQHGRPGRSFATPSDTEVTNLERREDCLYRMVLELGAFLPVQYPSVQQDQVAHAEENMTAETWAQSRIEWGQYLKDTPTAWW